MNAIAKKLASQKIKVATFVLTKVMARLQKQKVVRKSGASYKLTGKPIPKAMSKAAALRKARAVLKQKAKKGGKKAKKVKKAKKAKKARKAKKSKKAKKARKSAKKSKKSKSKKSRK